MSDSQHGNLWEKMGALDELEIMQVLTTLFATYEKLQQHDPENSRALHFFTNLELAISQASECNLNRR